LVEFQDFLFLAGIAPRHVNHFTLQIFLRHLNVSALADLSEDETKTHAALGDLAILFFEFILRLVFIFFVTACGFDLTAPGYAAEVAVSEIEDRRIFRMAVLDGFAPDWFRHGALRVQDGAAAGLSGTIKRDVMLTGARQIELWHPLRADISPGDTVRIIAGCDKRTKTCRFKFDNYLNFQGFPDIPGDDWSISDPSREQRLDGGSRRR